MENLDKLVYWITEREKIRLAKEAGQPKPWSSDPVFQQVYFCNVNREHDRVTKFIRNFYRFNARGIKSDFELNIALARLINWPQSLRGLGRILPDDFESIEETLTGWQDAGFKVFGDAYIVSTNGHAVPKAQYLCRNLLPAAHGAITAGISAIRGPSLALAHAALMRANGLGSFLAAQIVADLKYTKGHPLTNAGDWGSWCAPGPGSIRGLAWLGMTKEDFITKVLRVRVALVESEQLTDEAEGWLVDLQNLQNCLCEFDKFMRVSNGTGRSKRRYPGV